MARKANFKTILKRQKKYADAEVSQELRDTGLEMRTSHEHVVREWTHKPVFKAEVNEQPYLKTVTIKVKGEAADIWTFVDKGTKPHDITAKNVPFLKFQSGYSARTAPVAKFNQVRDRNLAHGCKSKRYTIPETKPANSRKPFLRNSRHLLRIGYRRRLNEV